MPKQVPVVAYLKLGDRPHLSAQSCVECAARFFDYRNACASCGATEFKSTDIATDGVLTTFTVVTFARPGVPVPFVAGVVDCDGTSVRANIVNVDPDRVHLSMKVRLVTSVLGVDDDGTEAIGFGFEPVEAD
ncbi:Zn-ribbon domain-containing OB-fold protein [Rhodococcus sp. NPDC003382]